MSAKPTSDKKKENSACGNPQWTRAQPLAQVSFTPTPEAVSYWRDEGEADGQRINDIYNIANCANDFIETSVLASMCALRCIGNGNQLAEADFEVYTLTNMLSDARKKQAQLQSEQNQHLKDINDQRRKEVKERAPSTNASYTGKGSFLKHAIQVSPSFTDVKVKEELKEEETEKPTKTKKAKKAPTTNIVKKKTPSKKSFRSEREAEYDDFDQLMGLGSLSSLTEF